MLPDAADSALAAITQAGGPLYSDDAIAISNAAPLPSVGDEAVWTAPAPNHTVPVIAAHKGSTTCTVTPGLDVDQTPMAYTGSPPIVTVTDAAELHYAQAEGQLCKDVFGAG